MTLEEIRIKLEKRRQEIRRELANEKLGWPERVELFRKQTAVWTKLEEIDAWQMLPGMRPSAIEAARIFRGKWFVLWLLGMPDWRVRINPDGCGVWERLRRRRAICRYIRSKAHLHNCNGNCNLSNEAQANQAVCAWVRDRLLLRTEGWESLTEEGWIAMQDPDTIDRKPYATIFLHLTGKSRAVFLASGEAANRLEEDLRAGMEMGCGDFPRRNGWYAGVVLHDSAKRYPSLLVSPRLLR